MLTAASLMTGEAGFADGVAVARRNPRLAVGLHLTLTDGTPTLDPARIPALVRADGRFRDDMPRLGLDLVASAAARAQMRAEVEAQCVAFRATGLRLDHVNAHRHFHLHPVIGAVAAAAAARHGAPCLRVPWEPPALVAAADRATPPGPAAHLLRPFAALLRAAARRHGLRIADRVVGLAWSGRFTGARLAAVLPLLPPGVTEIYLHPATASGFPGGAAGYDHAGELAALLDPAVREAVAAGGFALGGLARATAP